jgi:hypothetical protein
MLDGPDIMKYIKFEKLQWAGHVVSMDNSKIPKKVLNDKFHGRRPVGRPQLIREKHGRKDSLLLQNITEWRRLAGERDIRRQTPEEASAICRLSRY